MQRDTLGNRCIGRLRQVVQIAILGGMTLKTAGFLAFVGTIFATILLVWNLAVDIVSVARGLMPAARLFAELVYAFAAATVAIFFFVFQKQQG